jgi:BolA protein
VSVKSRIEEKLRRAFEPANLDVVDESHLHQGHVGARPGGETHFRVRITAAGFFGKNRVERHRMINAVLAEELADRVHALSLHVSAPGEAAGSK